MDLAVFFRGLDDCDGQDMSLLGPLGGRDAVCARESGLRADLAGLGSPGPPRSPSVNSQASEEERDGPSQPWGA